MLLEAVDCPIRYLWPEGEIRLMPGQPVSIPSDRGLKILKKCGAKVKKVQPDWIGVWRELVKLIDGITKVDPRFHPVCDALKECDRCFDRGDWPAFQRGAGEIRRLVLGK